MYAYGVYSNYCPLTSLIKVDFHITCPCTSSTSSLPAKAKGDRPSSTSSDDPGGKQSPAKPDKPDKPEKKERSGRKESKKDKSKTAVPPVEASQPPPGPLVPLGRPKERVLKRPRSVTLSHGWLIKTDPLSLLSSSFSSCFSSLPLFSCSYCYLVHTARWIILGIPVTCTSASTVWSLLDSSAKLSCSEFCTSLRYTSTSAYIGNLLARVLSGITPPHTCDFWMLIESHSQTNRRPGNGTITLRYLTACRTCSYVCRNAFCLEPVSSLLIAASDTPLWSRVSPWSSLIPMLIWTAWEWG